MKLLRLHSEDNVAVALDAIAAGEAVGPGVAAASDIPAMHKLATRAIASGERILKYGQPIGTAARAISAGEHVHDHNCMMTEARQDAVPGGRPAAQAASPAPAAAYFDGFRRQDGRVGTRNYIGVITSVNCSATVARQIAQEAERAGLIGSDTGVDGVVAITHNSGCGMDASSEGFTLLRRTLDGYIDHPNFGGVLVVGLGCEVMQSSSLGAGPQVRKLDIQDAGGTRAAIDQGLALVAELIGLAADCRRERVPAGELTLALQCGGSDGYSGITANPALGVAADLLIRQGGSAILAETPEIYGAEHLLIERARSPEVARALIERVEWWRDYAARNGSTLNSNPTPGNRAGGISTILEKSLGAQAKSGSTSLNAVIRYAERLPGKGFTFMDSPGFDPASVTGQVASGANMICFTTGRGSAFGFKPVPSIKLATNSALYARMQDDMDINCGTIADETETVAECGQRIFDQILAVASGRRTCSEALGYGDNEFTPWQLGAVY